MSEKITMESTDTEKLNARKIEECEGYKKLLAAVEKDCKEGNTHDYRGKFQWVIERARHYGEKLGIDPIDILDAWEKQRSYWYMNYYQDYNWPLIKHETVRVFDTIADLKASIAGKGFRCPNCGGISKSAYECDSGLLAHGKTCDWKSFGLFGCMGKGVFIYVKEKLSGQEIFMPVVWEEMQKVGEK